jgi:atypical dual specificity phosphatase
MKNEKWQSECRRVKIGVFRVRTRNMAQPYSFSWIEKPLLAALGRPDSAEDMEWLRRQGIDLLVSLTEDPPNSRWINEAGLMLVHVPVIDMEAPTQAQLTRSITSIQKAHESSMGVAVHCGAGLGRTGVVIACYFVGKGLSADDAIARIRRLRPGSVETEEQAESVREFARRRLDVA